MKPKKGKKGTLKAIREKLDPDSDSQTMLFRVSDEPLKKALFNTTENPVQDPENDTDDESGGNVK